MEGSLTRPRQSLGRTGLSAFPLAYGCWRFAGTSVSKAREKIEAALGIGVNLFDLADIYGSDGAAEALFGRVLATDPSLRSRVLIATKCGIVPGIPYDSSRRHIVASAEASLRRLRTGVLDLLQIHRPDLLTHPEEVAAALDQLRSQGKIREAGVSNYTPAQVEALVHFLPFPLATHQIELSVWRWQALTDGVVDQCLQLGLTPLAWSPLAGGALGLSPAEARRQSEGGRLAGVIEALDRLAAREQVARSAVALAFLLAHPARIVPILGTRRPQRITESAAALHLRLSRRDWYGLLVAAQGRPLP